MCLTAFAIRAIAQPMMPESAAYVPTQMADVPDVDPMVGIPMIAIPQANNHATAELTYPIELPQGRQGMQPNVDLHYSSKAGNGVLGIGWSIHTPAITIDTRWGVPRYDPQYETEQYLVNGEAVLFRDDDGTAKNLPYQDNSFIQRQSGKTRFYARDTKNQDRVYRFGNNPTNYWWAVTNNSGITTYYGRTFAPNNLQNQTIDEQSVVRTADGCIAYWAATASIDPHGNYILYANEKQNNTIYVQRIDYTGNVYQQVPPIYSVCMGYQSREDISSNGRLGVLQEEKRLLCHLLVQYRQPSLEEKLDADNLAAYYMQYTSPQEKTLYKTRLAEVVMLDSVHDLLLDDICSLDEIIDGKVERNPRYKEQIAEAEKNGDKYLLEQLLNTFSQPYGKNSIPASRTLFTYTDAPAVGSLFSSASSISNSANTPLSASNNTSWSIGGTATVGIGSNVAMTTLSGGGNYNFSRSKGQCSTLLLDLDGDGLTDIVYEENGYVYYKKQCKQGNQYVFTAPKQVQGLTRLSREVTNTHTWGLQLSLVANLSYSNPISTTYTDTYFTDVNGDGLPDMIDGDNILINQLVNGVPSFGIYTGVESQTIAVNNSRCGTVILDGEVDEHLECELQEVLVASYALDEFFGSTSDYDIGVESVDDKTEKYPEMTYSDKGVVSLKGQDEILSEIESITSQSPEIPKTEYKLRSAKAKNAIDSDSDSLIYRIENGKVNAYKLEYVCTATKTDPNIETVRVWVAPRTGTISITDSISLLSDTAVSRSRSITADGVEYIIQHCGAVVAQSDSMHLHANSYTLLQKGQISADDYSKHPWQGTCQVTQGDILMFRLHSGDNSLYDKTAWRHTIRYIDDNTAYDSHNDFICVGDGHFQAVRDGNMILSFSGSNDSTVPIVLNVRKNTSTLLNTTLYHGTIDLSSITTTITADDSIFISLSPISTTTEPQWSSIHLLPHLQYIADFPTDDNGATVHDTVVYYPDIQIAYTSHYPITSPYRKLFGTLHKGWGVFAYQDIDDSDTIILDSLVNTQQLAAEYAQQNSTSFQNNQSVSSFSRDDDWSSQVNAAFAEGNVFNPISESNYWIPMRADTRTEHWVTYGNMGCIGKSLHSNAREITLSEDVEDIVEYDSSLPFQQGEVRKNNFVRKQSRSIQHSISWGAPVIMNAFASKGEYEAVVDYMDMNGDGYPDFVGRGGVQYSMPWGGIGRLQAVKYFSPYNSENTSEGVSFSACPADIMKLASNDVQDDQFYLNAVMGGSSGNGSSSTQISYLDINGDGLPDKVDADNHTVRYNLGYGFSEAYTYSGNINRGANSSGSLNTSTPSFSLGQVSISGGVGGSISTNKTGEMLVDVNGDGLIDKVREASDNTIQVAYNRGIDSNGILFDSWKTLSGITSMGENNTQNMGTTLSATGGFTFLGSVKCNIGIQSSPYGTSFSEGEVTLADMNGDGIVDYVYRSNNQIYVRYNTAGQANLLTSVVNPTGQRITLNYELSDPTSAHRYRQWELRTVVTEAPDLPSPNTETCVTEMAYKNAYYDNYEKTDYGYEYVRAITNNEKVKEEYYHNQSYLQNGELREDWIRDTDGKAYIRHIHGSMYVDLSSGASSEGNTICDDANAYIEQDGYWTEYYETESSPQITTYSNLVYDQHHNMIEYIDRGDIAIPDDDWHQEITYLPTTANNMISLPKTTKVYGAGGELLRSSYINYSPFGRPAHIHLEEVNQNIDAITHLHYDSFGNINGIISPANSNNENSWTVFYYDSVACSNIVYTDNTFHVRTYTQYDYRYGVPLRTKDPAGNEIHFDYNYKGRLYKVIAPLELAHEKDYTIKYEYNLINHNLKATPSYAYTHVYKDLYDSLFAQREVTLYDQYGRILQRKHYAEVNGQDTWIVDNAEVWDALGRPIAQEYPFIAQQTPNTYEPINTQQVVVATQYDVLDRPLKVINADGTTQIYKYHFASDIHNVVRLMTQTEDENHVKTQTLQSPQDWLIEQVAGDGSTTFFEYSPLGELLRTTDAEGYQTAYSYDMFGHLIARIHPDAGKTIWKYDPAGNRIAQQTANLALHGEAIKYIYQYDRLSEIQYPHHKENDVLYLYDQAGRIAVREDGTGCETFLYDMLGNVAQSIRRIILPTENQAYTFRTQFKYDSFGRMRNIIYPDGEVLHYGYTTGGLLKSVAGIKHGKQNLYLWDRQYDEQGRKVLQKVGNGVWTKYSYDAQRQWLSNLYTELPDGTPLQDMHYQYDPVGNIVSIEQLAPLTSDPLGGAYANNYAYDKQYRLTKSNGAGGFPYFFMATYSPSGRMGSKFTSTPSWQTDLLLGYDDQYATHQPRTIFDPNIGNLNLFWDANGNLAQMVGCKQNRAHFHEWDEDNKLRFAIGEKFAGCYGYDGNGERTYKLTGTSSIDQVNSGYTGAHVLLDNAVLYPSPYLVVTPKTYTKHYYAGTERLATVIGMGGFADLVQPIDQVLPREEELISSFYSYYKNNDPFRYDGNLSKHTKTTDINKEQHSEIDYQCESVMLYSLDLLVQKDILLHAIAANELANEAEQEIFFSHGDHLGSAHWITDLNAAPIQYIHYAPYGELVENQTIVGYDERYKYTGKERDKESGYNYFGARFYSSPFSFWLSVDPLADKYPNISPYAYCGWNPVKYIDLEGMDWTDINNNVITDHSNIKAYIFYNPKDFKRQTIAMLNRLENKYGKGSVALSNVTTANEFAEDWKNMNSPNILEININHHGSNQAVHLDYTTNQYITSTGTGYTQSGKFKAINVGDLGIPKGNIINARLNLNSCHSNSKGSFLGNIRLNNLRIPGSSATLVGNKETIMIAFWNNFNFKSIRGTSAGVSYNRCTLQPEPQFWFQSWTIFFRR